MDGAQKRILAQRYARALFESSREPEKALSMLSDRPDPKGVLSRHSPTVGGSHRQRRGSLPAHAPEILPRFLDLLSERKRLFLLPLIVERLEKLVLTSQGKLKAKVSSAQALPPAQKEALRRRLEELSGAREIVLECARDPELFGGAVVRMGDWVLDGSFRGQLSRLKEEWEGVF